MAIRTIAGRQSLILSNFVAAVLPTSFSQPIRFGGWAGSSQCAAHLSGPSSPLVSREQAASIFTCARRIILQLRLFMDGDCCWSRKPAAWPQWLLFLHLTLVRSREHFGATARSR